jgi:glycosyltransferase involved in cell wall biosynthesis
MISIALATYNGELYISELLHSISNQTTLPDELIISDDSSTDSTLKIVNEFARNATFPIKILINKARLGSTANFEVAIRACSGDIIFPCDQDDIWYPHKIEHMHECLMNNPSAGAVFSDADVVDQDLNLLKNSLWARKRIKPQELSAISSDGNAFKMVIKRNIVTGTAMAFRAKYRENILPIPKEWEHDYWITLIISMSAKLIPIPSTLIAYRQHDSNQIGAPQTRFNKIINGSRHKGKSFHEIYSPKAKAFQKALDLLIESSNNTAKDKQRITLITDIIAFHHARSLMPKSRWKRLPIIWKEFIIFRRYQRYKKPRHAIKDLVHRVD